MKRLVKKAIEQIDQKLEYWNKFIIHKCKQRLTKLTEMLKRMRKLKLKGAMNVETIRTKTEARDKIRMAKAEQRAHVESEIEKELLERLKNGTYGELYDDLLNLNKRAFNKHIEEDVIEDDSIDISLESKDLEVY